MDFLLQMNQWAQVLALILLVIMNFLLWRRLWRETCKLYRNITYRFVLARITSRNLVSRKQLNLSRFRSSTRRGRLN
ncbi:MAG: hypothetical protein A4E54_01471 [Pelotomaculum sp. PtaB.Bin117]|nr:MAG: hypothetical protein A4E54_01471 [Pelotomaculum sp. PtaB.Bin117]OPY63095.1 MAG: hypothetical protein A4E56_00810 [Pelotomaculum sp. PtaU1.Bin065]